MIAEKHVIPGMTALPFIFATIRDVTNENKISCQIFLQWIHLATTHALGCELPKPFVKGFAFSAVVFIFPFFHRIDEINHFKLFKPIRHLAILLLVTL